MTQRFPAEATDEPCRECPWRRASAAGWLGPSTADEWLELLRSDEPIACHLTIRQDGSWDDALQCRGAATFRANTAKSPRDPRVVVGPVDRVRVFAMAEEFMDHHGRD